MTARHLWALILVAYASCLARPLGAQHAEDQRELLRGVERLERPGGALPGPVMVFGQQAFPVVTQTMEGCTQAVVAGARHGKGRLLAFGHPALYAPTRGGKSAQRFLANTRAWLSGKPDAQAKLLVIAEDRELARAYAPFAKSVESETSSRLPSKLSAFDWIIWESGALDLDSSARLADYVRAGGGLQLGVCPWGVNQGYERRGLQIRDELPENRFLVPMGLVFGLGYADAAEYQLTAKESAAAHAGLALDRLTSSNSAADPSATALVAKTLRSLPPGSVAFGEQLLAKLGQADLEPVAPRANEPASPSDPLTHLGFLMHSIAWDNADPDQVPAAPGSLFFPGEVPADAPRIERRLQLPARRAAQGGWISTGLYAVAGEPMQVRREGLPGAAAWRLRIGAHQDTLWHKSEWKRWPEISMQRALVEQRLRMASPFGGLVYLLPPEQLDPGGKPFRFQFSGVVEAPYFVLGDKQSEAEWHERRLAPAPWAELECEGVVLSVPAEAVRQLDDPVQLMGFWQRAMQCYPELRGEPQPARAERLVEDIQISAGWMHSGYPVMTHGAADRHHSDALDYKKLSSEGDWGYFHEFGHNAQKSDWTFEGTGEVTNNLFSLYVTERMTGIKAWDNAWLANQKQKVKPYLERGARFEEWKADPGLALMMYATIQHEFGWEPIQRALAAYLEAPASEKPKDDADKRDRWLMRLSAALKRDLGPYFQLWGVPVSEAALGATRRHKSWMPKR